MSDVWNSEQFWWYVSRATGVVAWVALLASMLWGIFSATKFLQTYKRPRWINAMHSWLGGLACVFTAVRNSRTFSFLPIHLASYLTFWLATMHGVLAGTDADSTAFRWITSIGVTALMLTAIYRVLTRRPPRSATA